MPPVPPVPPVLPVGKTVSVVELLSVPVVVTKAAVMLVVPGASAVARPVELIVATEVAEELQVTEFVRSFVEPSE